MATESGAAATAPPTLTLREVLQIDVIRRIWYAQVIGAALASTVVIGFSFTAIMVPAQTLTQRETPHDMLGRVASTQISVLFLAQILGLVLSGTWRRCSASGWCLCSVPACRWRSSG